MGDAVHTWEFNPHQFPDAPRLQFGCFTPLLQAHGRFEQEAWTYDEQTLNPWTEAKADTKNPEHGRC